MTNELHPIFGDMDLSAISGDETMSPVAVERIQPRERMAAAGTLSAMHYALERAIDSGNLDRTDWAHCMIGTYDECETERARRSSNGEAYRISAVK